MQNIYNKIRPSILFILLALVSNSCSEKDKFSEQELSGPIKSLQCYPHQKKVEYTFNFDTGELYVFNNDENKFNHLSSQVINKVAGKRIIKSYKSKKMDDYLLVNTFIYLENEPQKRYDISTEKINLTSLQAVWKHQHDGKIFKGEGKCKWIQPRQSK